MKKIRCALIGPGNIGTDLLYKLKRSPVLEPVWMVGIDPTSDGLKRAAEMGMKVTAEGVDGLLPHVKEDNIQIAFDATSAYVHAENSRKLNELGVMMIDLTPAAIGPFCVPPVNLKEHVGKREMNVNMVTCGGQATIPLVAAISRVQPVKYGEIVATVSSKSAGPGTRKNIDEFTRTTAGGIEKVGGAKQGKAIIIINPAEPPLIMRDTIHCLTAGEPDVADKLKKGHKAIGRDYKVHLDSYNLMPALKGEARWPRRDFIYWTDDGSVAALRYDNWKISFLKQNAHGLHVWIQPFEELRAPILTNLRMDPFELAQEIAMDYGRWFVEHMYLFAPAGTFVGRWLQSFREFPPRQKPGSFNLDRVMEAVTKPHKGAN